MHYQYLSFSTLYYLEQGGCELSRWGSGSSNDSASTNRSSTNGSDYMQSKNSSQTSVDMDEYPEADIDALKLASHGHDLSLRRIPARHQL